MGDILLRDFSDTGRQGLGGGGTYKLANEVHHQGLLPPQQFLRRCRQNVRRSRSVQREEGMKKKTGEREIWGKVLVDGLFFHTLPCSLPTRLSLLLSLATDWKSTTDAEYRTQSQDRRGFPGDWGVDPSTLLLRHAPRNILLGQKEKNKDVYGVGEDHWVSATETQKGRERRRIERRRRT
jgi:hypothetical protein